MSDAAAERAGALPGAGLRWQRQAGGEWRAIEAAALPSWVKSKKSVLFAAAGETLEAREGGQVVRYRLTAD